jgi:hypothetical protein
MTRPLLCQLSYGGKFHVVPLATPDGPWPPRRSARAGWPARGTGKINVPRMAPCFYQSSARLPIGPVCTRAGACRRVEGTCSHRSRFWDGLSRIGNAQGHRPDHRGAYGCISSSSDSEPSAGQRFAASSLARTAACPDRHVVGRGWKSAKASGIIESGGGIFGRQNASCRPTISDDGAGRGLVRTEAG